VDRDGRAGGTGETTQSPARSSSRAAATTLRAGLHPPSFEGRERFQGQVVHPQHWPEDLDYAGKRVVVIGSGATAVTLVPAMTDKAAHVTMLQRSPTYIMPVPGDDPLQTGAPRLPPKARLRAHALEERRSCRR
jgi:cation diffusion facilitator CzcD-associated flavoprotein CzcO